MARRLKPGIRKGFNGNVIVDDSFQTYRSPASSSYTRKAPTPKVGTSFMLSSFDLKTLQDDNSCDGRLPN
ncbi:hypothetical protein ACLOJK_022783, partial [Asimina triloba]